MARNYLVPVYLVYLAVSGALVVWLARTLYRSGIVFLEDVYEDPRVARSVNKLLVIGFYMLNLGYAALLLEAEAAPTAVAAVEVLGRKFGILLVSLAGLHFLNMYVFYRVRRRAGAEVLPPPVAPQVTLPADPAQGWVPAQ